MSVKKISDQASKKLKFIEHRTPDLGCLTNSYLFQHVHFNGHAFRDQDLWMFLLSLLEGDRQDKPVAARVCAVGGGNRRHHSHALVRSHMTTLLLSSPLTVQNKSPNRSKSSSSLKLFKIVEMIGKP